MSKTIESLRKRPFKQRFFGDKNFYRMVLGIVLPIMVQNGISTFVSLLDNLMVGMIGTEQMSGVSIANQLFFVYNLSLFGGMSGIGIFTVQYFGKGDIEGVRKTVRYKLWLGFILTVAAVFVLLLFTPQLVSLYLHDVAQNGNPEDTLRYGVGYLRIILLSFPAFFLLQIYASTLRECGETRVPMVAGIAAVTTNLVLNYLLIYGKLGLPKLGVYGAAIATVISRYLEVGIVAFWAHRHTDRQPWTAKLYQTLHVPAADVKRFFLMGSPLLANELLWSLAVALTNQYYSLRGLDVIAAQNIANNLTQFTNIIYQSMGSAIGIIIGQLLGAGEMVNAKDTDNKLICFSVMLSLVSSGLLLALSPLFTQIYNTTEAIRLLAMRMMYITALFSIQHSFIHATYFTLRSGGKTVITFLFDCVSAWLLEVPAAFLLCHFTSMNILNVMFFVNFVNIIKAVLGYILLRKNIWIYNLVSEPSAGSRR